MMGKWMQRTQDLHLWHNKYFFFLERCRRAASHFIKKRIKTMEERLFPQVTKSRTLSATHYEKQMSTAQKAPKQL
jgi:hypothetical protein